MNQVDIYDFLKLDLPVSFPKSKRTMVNIRGTNGAGKSTIIKMMLQTDPNIFEVLWKYDGKYRIIATVMPTYQTLVLGHYHNKTGGLDTVGSTQETKDATEIFWNSNYHLFMEGCLASTVRQTYIDLYQNMNAMYDHREVIIFNILPPIDVCFQRIYQRNGGKKIKEWKVISKYQLVEKNVEHFANAGFTSLKVDNTNVNIEDTLSWFFNTINASIA